MERCELCGKEEADLIGGNCLLCDKIVADAYENMGMEF